MASRTARLGSGMLCMYARGDCPIRAATDVYGESRLSGIDPAVGVVSRWMDPAVAMSIVAEIRELQQVLCPSCFLSSKPLLQLSRNVHCDMYVASDLHCY